MLLDAQRGVEQRAYPNAANHFLTWPAWSEDGRYLSFVAIDKSRGNALIRLDVQSAAADTLIPWTFHAMARPVEHGGRVYFGSPQSGIDNIHVLELATKRQYQVTSRLFGAYHADVTTRGGRDMLVFRDYGGEGDEIAEMSLDPTSWIASNNDAKGDVLLAEPLAIQENAIVNVDSVIAWPIAPYSGLGRIFDVHSLALFPGDDIDPWIVQVYSRNVLNTLGATAAYRFNPVQHTHGFDVGASYAGLFPIFDFGLRMGTDAATYEDSTGAALPYTCRERSPRWRSDALTTLEGWPCSKCSPAPRSVTHKSTSSLRFVLDNNNGVLRTAAYTYRSAFEPAALPRLVERGYTRLSLPHTPLGATTR